MVTLKDLNQERRNFPALDLGDDETKVAFQVTSTVDEDKVRKTLEKFVALKLDARFSSGVRFLSLSHKEVKVGKKLRAKYPFFDPDQHVVTPSALIQKVNDCYKNDGVRFARILEALERSVSPLVATTSAPVQRAKAESGMKPMPTFLKDHLRGSVIGRVKLKLFEEITGHNDCLPSAPAIRHFILDHYRVQPEIGMLFQDILNVGSVYALPETGLTEPDDLVSILGNLEENPLQAPVFLEFASDSNDPRKDDLGILVHRESLLCGGWIYVVTTILTDKFPTALGGRVEVRASKEHPEPAISVLTRMGWTHYSQSNYANSEAATFAIRILTHVDKNRLEEFKFIELKDLQKLDADWPATWKAPVDPEYDRLVRLALSDRIPCTRINIPLALIKPYDLHFCLTYPLDALSALNRVIAYGTRPKLLLYWKGNKFVTSDDYASYLAYRTARITTVPAVVMGAYPRSLARPQKSGGSELIPPIMLRRVPERQQLETELGMYLLDQRLRSGR